MFLVLDIRLSFNKGENKFIIEDNGIGLSESEAMNNLGTIAKSGSQEFMNAVQEEHSASAQVRFYGKTFNLTPLDKFGTHVSQDIVYRCSHPTRSFSQDLKNL